MRYLNHQSLKVAWNLLAKDSIHISQAPMSWDFLTNWCWVTHICVSKLTIIGSNNGLLFGWCQAIIWTNDGISLIGPLGKNFSETLIKIHTFSVKEMHLKMSGKWRPFLLSLKVLMVSSQSSVSIPHLLMVLFNSLCFRDAKWHWSWYSLPPVMSCHLFGFKPLSD